jgi:F0F1-type ATP synthase assembly protein I
VRSYVYLSLVIQLGWVLALSILIPIFIGVWLDQQAHTPACFTLLGMLLGLTVGSIGVYRLIIGAARQRGQEDKA